jgi:glucose-6-phosphate 1-dehydrogenase
MLSKGKEGRASRLVHIDLPVAAALGRPLGPYERLLHDALVGDHSLFTREDTVEETWRVLQPLVHHPPSPAPDRRGSWGPQVPTTCLETIPLATAVAFRPRGD